MQILVFILIAWWLFGGDKKGKKRKAGSYREWEKRRREQYQYLYGDRP